MLISKLLAKKKKTPRLIGLLGVFSDIILGSGSPEHRDDLPDLSGRATTAPRGYSALHRNQKAPQIA